MKAPVLSTSLALLALLALSLPSPGIAGETADLADATDVANSAKVAGSLGPEAESPTVYKVHVDILAQNNRVVTGLVRGHKLVVDQPKHFGGDDTAPTPPEMLAFAVGACVVSAAELVAGQRGINLKSVSASVDGELDFARALGMKTDRRTGFAGLKVTLSIDSDMNASETARFLDDVMSICPMCDNLRATTPITHELTTPPAR